MSDESSLEALKRRLGPTDELPIRLLMSIPPERRVRTMIGTADVIMTSLRDRLRQAHPELFELELSRLMFEQLYRNG